MAKFKGLTDAKEAANLWAATLPPTLNLRAALSYPELYFLMDAAYLFRSTLLERSMPLQVVDINPKLPILQWMCESPPPAERIPYARMDIASIEPSPVWSWNQPSVRPVELRPYAQTVFEGVFRGPKPTMMLCTVQLDWGRRAMEKQNSTWVTRLPFAEERSLPQLMSVIRDVAKVAQQNEAKRVEDASACVFVLPLPAVRRDVPFLTPDRERHGVSAEGYRKRPFSSQLNRLMRSMLRSDATANGKKIKDLPPHAYSEIVLTKSKSYLLIAVSNRAPIKDLKLRSQLKELSGRANDWEYATGSAMTFTRGAALVPPTGVPTPPVWFQHNPSVAQPMGDVVAVVLNTNRRPVLQADGQYGLMATQQELTLVWWALYHAMQLRAAGQSSMSE